MDAAAAAPTVRLATNAPAHWPRVRAPRRFLGRNDPTFKRKFVAGIRSSLEGAGLRILHEPWRTLASTGVLEATFLVRDKGRDVPVFVYPVADKDASAHFMGACKLLAALKLPTPVHYAAAALPASAAKDPTVPMDLDVFSVVKDRPGMYAMWWATPKDRDFLQSSVRGHIHAAYRTLDGLDEYAYAHVLRALGGPQTMQRAPLPDDHKPFVACVRGPECHAVITASRGKGIRFHFDRDEPRIARDRFWRSWARTAQLLADQWRDAGALKTSYHHERPLRWFDKLVDAIESSPPQSDVRERLVGGHEVR